MISEAPGLSKREHALLAEWERDQTRSVTLREIGQAVGANAARMAASRLVRKGVLDRVRPGLYVVRPFRAVARPLALPALIAVELLLAQVPHYVGGLIAFTLHRLTPQQHTSLVDVFVGSYRRPRRLGSARVVFHRRSGDVFSSGITHVDVDDVSVAVSDPERTVLDALEEFAVVGGMEEAIQLFRAALPKIDSARLVAQALEVARGSTCQRLGLLLEREDVQGPFMRRLADRAAAGKSLHMLVPGRAKDGPVNPTWRVVENDRATRSR